MKKLLGGLLIMIGFGASAAEPVTPQIQESAPVPTCEIRRGPWCIIAYGQIIELRPTLNYPDRYERRQTFTLYPAYKQSDDGLIVVETYGCRGEPAIADDVALLGIDDNFRWNQKNWKRLRIRLTKNDSCRLDFLTPIKDGQATHPNFHSELGSVRACVTAQCIDPPIAYYYSQSKSAQPVR